jgi:DNA polymerase III alpha subunit (gram-positive type)
MSNYRCPKCQSTDTEKDRDPFRGADTGDRICNKCGHVGWHTSFEKSTTPPTAEASHKEKD